MKSPLAFLVLALCGLAVVGSGCGKKKDDGSGMVVDYQSVGSGQGKKLVFDGVVDFGASDAAMTPEEIKKAEDKEARGNNTNAGAERAAPGKARLSKAGRGEKSWEVASRPRSAPDQEGDCRRAPCRALPGYRIRPGALGIPNVAR